jgi:hypothetical protein
LRSSIALGTRWPCASRRSLWPLRSLNSLQTRHLVL